MRSTRLPGKMLADVGGKPLVAWTGQRARESGADQVVIATDHQSIADALSRLNFHVCTTSPQHATGTDRIAEAVTLLGYPPDAIVVNVQGDEPLLAPSSIDQVVAALQDDPGARMSTAVRPAESDAEWLDRNVVKAVLATTGDALYFSRAPIPSFPTAAGPKNAARWVHIGLYGFRREALFQFASMAPTPLELEERLEQLRALENGWRIRVVAVSEPTCAVDVPSDVLRVEKILADNRMRRAS